MKNFILKGVSLDVNGNLSIPESELEKLGYALKELTKPMKNFIGRYEFPPAHVKSEYLQKIKYLNDSSSETPIFDKYGKLDVDKLDTTTWLKYYCFTQRKFRDGRYDFFEFKHFPLLMIKMNDVDRDNLYHFENDSLVKLVTNDDFVDGEYTEAFYTKLEDIDKYIYIYDDSQIANYFQPNIDDVYFNSTTDKFYIFKSRTIEIYYRDVQDFQIDDVELYVPKNSSENKMEIIEYFWQEYQTPENHLILENKFHSVANKM